MILPAIQGIRDGWNYTAWVGGVACRLVQGRDDTWSVHPPLNYSPYFDALIRRDMGLETQ